MFLEILKNLKYSKSFKKILKNIKEAGRISKLFTQAWSLKLYSVLLKYSAPCEIEASNKILRMLEIFKNVYTALHLKSPILLQHKRPRRC